VVTALRAAWRWLNAERGRKRTPRAQKRRKQRGVALIAVMIAIAITLVISNEFGTTTNVDMIAAANYRDQMRSHFLAHSAVNLSELVIRIQQRLDNIKELQQSGIKITDFADQVLLAFCGNPEEVQAAVGFTPSTVKGLGADVGTCGIQGRIETDDKLININCANGTTAIAGAIQSALYALVYFPAYDPVFDEPDAEGYRRDRQGQVDSIMDYVDSNTMRGSNRGAVEDYGYESLKDPYRAKNNYIDTVGELRLARGVDDRFWTLFGSAFTVYGGCKINLSAVDNPQLIAGILMLSAKNQSDPVIQNPQKLFALAAIVAKAKQFGETFTSADDFITFVKDPSTSINMLASHGDTMAGSAAGAALQSGIPGLQSGEKLGLELDKAKLAQITTSGPFRTYRVQAWGEIERKQKMPDGSPVFPPIRTTVTGVWDMKIPPQNVRKPPVPKGAWVFLKED
jgi:Tfp pilus assembly protein PilX